MRILPAIALCVAAFSASAQQLYRWTDEKGRVHVTDTPPPPSVKGVKRTGPQGDSSDTEAPQSAGPEPFALQQARKNFPVTLYTVPECEACNAARNLLNKRGVPFKEVSVTEPAVQDDFKKTIGGNTVPAMVVGSTVQKGFEETAYQRLLDAAGYPATGTLPARSQAAPAAPAAPGLPKVEPVPPETPPGPYSPGAPPQPTTKKK
jgi:glutaredoxin